MLHIGIVEQTLGERNFKERKGRHRTGRSSGVHQSPITAHGWITVSSCGNFARRHHFSSWLSSVISIPGITMNLHANISLESSSSGNWHVTRQYWQSWFQQNRPYGIVSGLMN